MVPSRRLALKPPDTPANAAANPAIGCRPTDRKIIAPRGTSRTYPTSLAMLDITPANTITKVNRRRGAAWTSSLREVEIRPLFSATPMPSMATSTVPSGANPV